MMNRVKRLMAVLITLIMVFNALPVSAFAALAEGGNGVPEIVSDPQELQLAPKDPLLGDGTSYNINVEFTDSDTIPDNLYVYASVQRKNDNNELKKYYWVSEKMISQENKTFSITIFHISNGHPDDIQYQTSDTVTVLLVNFKYGVQIGADDGNISNGTIIKSGDSFGGYVFNFDSNTTANTTGGICASKRPISARASVSN